MASILVYVTFNTNDKVTKFEISPDVKSLKLWERDENLFLIPCAGKISTSERITGKTRNEIKAMDIEVRKEINQHFNNNRINPSID